MTEANETNGNDQSDPPQSHPMPLQMLVEASRHSNIERAIHNAMRKNFLEQRSITWKPTRVDLVINQSLTADFFAVRKKFELASNGNRCEFDERYAFLIDNDQQVSEICRNGYQCTETSFNVLGHSKYGVYVCKYADVCIRRASVRRTWEGNMAIKMIVFKIVEGKQTAALVRKGPKLQPIAPTAQFTSHCSVITPKETDDLEKQFDQSQIFLYEFDGRETLKRPHHCLPYAVVSLIQDGTEWPANFEELDIGMDLLDTDTLRVVAQSDDATLQNKLRENPPLAEAAAAALEHTYQEEPAPTTAPDQEPSPSSKTELNGVQNAPDSQAAVVMVNGSNVSPTEEHSPKTSSSPPSNNIDGLTNHADNGNAVPPPPPPPPPPPTTAASAHSGTSSSSSAPTSPTNVPSASTVTSSTPAASTVGSIPVAAYRQPASVLGAMPAAAALRAAPGAMYATAAGLTNGLGGQIIYGGIPIDALRGYPGAQYAIAAQAGQAMQQPALFAAQLQALAQQQQQQQQAAQLAAAVKQQQQQQQQQQSLIGGIPPGYTLVRTANGGLALLAQSPQANAAAAMQNQAAVQQSFIAMNAAGQQTAAAAGRLQMAMVGGQPQQILYQYAGQPGLQAAPTQYIQLPANYAQQPGAGSAYANQTQFQYLATSPTSNTPTGHAAAANVSSVVPSSSGSSMQAQAATALISPQKQSAATATAAAIQQQQQYQFAYAQQQQQQQQQQQAATNGTNGANAYHAAISQAHAQAQAQAQQQQQLQAAALAQQQQQFGLVQQFQYATQQAVPQQVYYASAGGQTIYQAGGQSYILAPASTASATSTGAPIMYSSGPVLHNGAGQQQQQQQQQATQSQQQQQLAYQILSSASNHGQPASSSAGPGVVAQQPPQLVQRTNVVPQVRHHPYRN